MIYLRSILFDAFIQLFLTRVVLFHDDLLFVAAKHGQVRLYVHWVVNAIFECLHTHFVHLFEDLIFCEFEWSTSRFECHLFKLLTDWFLDDSIFRRRR